MEAAELKSLACKIIDDHKDELNRVSQEIWSHPEENFQEHYCHQFLANVLEEKGFVVQKHYPLDTSFVARFGEENRLKLGVICEYDALPGIDHACGHNLIAEAGIAAALALQACIKEGLQAQVVVFGTPAEEGGGGKVKMIDAGLFADLTLCMMVHPTPFEIPEGTMLARVQLSIVYEGKASHAAAAPWEGVNALDAAVACYTSVSMLRQQMKPTCRMHGVIVDGGEKPNIIPRRAELEYYIRAMTNNDSHELRDRVKKCAEAAATATGCKVTISEKLPFYAAYKPNSVLIKKYVENTTSVGVAHESGKDHPFLASSDMGNVSHVVPSIHPWYKISTSGPNHTEDFTKAAAAPENQLPTLNAAKGMAMTAIDIVCSSSLQLDMENNFNAST